jgi:hypothetical protein
VGQAVFDKDPVLWLNPFRIERGEGEKLHSLSEIMIGRPAETGSNSPWLKVISKGRSVVLIPVPSSPRIAAHRL